jgi:hypothetical protein
MTTLHLMLAFVLCGLGAGCFVLYWFTAVSPKFTAAYRPFAGFGIASLVTGIAIASISAFYKNWLLKGKRSLLLRIGEVALLAGGCAVFFMAGQNLPAGIFGIVAGMIAIAAVWEARTPGAQNIIINSTGISIPNGATTKLLRWSEVESLLLRHSILSIELSGNRLMQRSIKTDDTDSTSLELFSAENIQLHAKERTANAEW